VLFPFLSSVCVGFIAQEICSTAILVLRAQLVSLVFWPLPDSSLGSLCRFAIFVPPAQQIPFGPLRFLLKHGDTRAFGFRSVYRFLVAPSRFFLHRELAHGSDLAQSKVTCADFFCPHRCFPLLVDVSPWFPAGSLPLPRLAHSCYQFSPPRRFSFLVSVSVQERTEGLLSTDFSTQSRVLIVTSCACHCDSFFVERLVLQRLSRASRRLSSFHYST
jgi:hypothetical protein